MKNKFEETLLDTGATIRRGYSFLLENAGKTIAFITGIVVSLVTFTEVGFCDFGTVNYITSVLITLLAGYIIYFSLEDAGEKLGCECEDYLSAEDRYKSAKSRLSLAKVSDLRAFLTGYSEEELEFRRRSLLFSHGLSLSDYEDYLNGETFDKVHTRVLKKAKKMRPIDINPRLILSKERSEGRSELFNPGKNKIIRLIIKMIPSSICMLFTVSLILGAKDGMTREFIIESILKLSALPIIGLKGYAEGYRYAKCDLPLWLDTKTRLITAFIDGAQS